MAVHPGSPTRYPNTTKTLTAKLPGGGRKARSTRHDSLYAGAFSVDEDHLPGTAEARLANDYKKGGTTDETRKWPIFVGRGYANTRTR